MIKGTVRKNVLMVTQKPKLVLVVALVLTLLAGVLASGLALELNWVALAPKGNPAVQEYERIIENFPTLSNVLVVVEGEDVVEMNQAVSELEEDMAALDDYVLSITTGLNQDFVLDYGLMLMDEREAEGIAYMLKDPNFVTFMTLTNTMMDAGMADDYSKAVLKDLVDLSTDYDGQSDEIKDLLGDFFSGNPLMMAGEGKMTILMIQPTFDIMDITMLEPGVEAMETTIQNISEKYPGISMQATGMHIVARDETASIQSDSSLTTILAIALILAILYFAFRSLSAPLLAFVPLIIGIIWTVGLTRVAVGRLNMMTAFSAAMLLGLGIDYSIHMYSSYTERRANGIEKKVALDHAISISGPGIITGALTTAVAFFALNISQLELLRELGTIMGLGIISTLVSVFWVLPSLLVLKKDREDKVQKIKGHYPWIGNIAKAVHGHKIPVIILLSIVTVFMFLQAQEAEFDLNLMNLEPANLDSINLMNYMVEEYDMSADSFSVAVDNLEDVYKYHEAYSQVDGIKEVVSIASFIPEAQDMEKRITLIETIQKMDQAPMYPYDEAGIDALMTQHTNRKVQETFVEDFYDQMSNLSKRMLEANPVVIDSLPKNYRDQYVSEDGKQFLITIYPDFDIWSNLNSEKGNQFFDDIADVNEKITGTPIFMKVLYDSASEEMFMIGGVLLSILAVILMIHFKSIKYTAMAITPLVLTMIFTVGTMSLIDLKFNIMNFLSILLIIGIGIDDGVHILHHHKHGVTKIDYLFASVGRAILLTTLTTVCGFGSLVFSSYRGIASLGASLAIGVIYAFVMTIIVLPLMLKKSA